jgi:ATP-dependent Clp protease ATP-binding subunit ClpC
MFDRFTDRARRVVVLAQEEARLLEHKYIGTEHILLGLIREGEGVGALVLQRSSVPLEAARAQIDKMVGMSGRVELASGHSEQLPFTPRAKKVFDLSLREALQFGHNYIGTEHILLALIREGEGVAVHALVHLGADLSKLRQSTIRMLRGFDSRGTVKLELHPTIADALEDWISHFDRANGPIAEGHPLRVLHELLSAATAEAQQAG